MSGQSFKALAILLAVWCRPAWPQEAAFQLYNGREVVGHTKLINLPDPALDALLASVLAQQFDTLLGSDRSLILYDCGPQSLWCADADFAFPKVFARAAAGLHLPPDNLARSWYLSASKDQNFKSDVDRWDGALARAPFQLLAIVNRMDLACWKDGRWEDVELRFVYGAVPRQEADPPGLTLILELVLPPLGWHGFQDLAAKWRDVGIASPSHFRQALRDTLRKSGYEHPLMARIRTNVDQRGPWKVSEWDLRRGAAVKAETPLAYAPLVDQFSDYYAQAQPGSADYSTYLDLWKDIGAIPGPKHIHIAESYLETMPEAYLQAPYDSPLAAPVNHCASQPTRNALALQRCTGCHLLETTPKNSPGFTHISNRSPGQSSTLSPFLIGSGQPTLTDIYYGSGAVELEVPYTDYKSGSGGQCNQQITRVAHRKFYDLGRRRLFLASVLAAQPTANETDISRITEFHTDYSH